VLYRLNGHLNTVALVAVGACGAASGRLVLATVFRRFQGRFSEKRRKNLDLVRPRLDGSKRKTVVGVALFALSPLPSAQLFEAAGLMKLPLVRLVLAFFAGRLVSYSFYVGGATAVANTSVGNLLAH
jgi:uncharacterized membrane protein YdjX (TVP38/TMEM64 family)